MNDRYIVGPHGTPVREIVKQSLFDTKQIATNVSMLTFFMNPTPGPLWSNMPASGQLWNPQEYYVFGIALEIFSVDPHNHGKIVAVEPYFHRMRLAILATAHLTFTIGCKPYLECPASEIIYGAQASGALNSLLCVRRLLPRQATETEWKEEYNQISQAPIQVIVGREILDKKDFYLETLIKKTERTIRIIITDVEPQLYYHDLTVCIAGKTRPLHIPSQQFFKVDFIWESSTEDHEGILGTIMLRTYLVGYKWREVQ